MEGTKTKKSNQLVTENKGQAKGTKILEKQPEQPIRRPERVKFSLYNILETCR